MRKTVLVRVFAAALVLLGAWIAFTQTQQAPAQLTLQKVKDDLYVIIGDGGNVAVYLTDEGVIVIDDKFERDYADIMAKIKSLTDKPVKYVLNTHQHGDHTGSNSKMLAANVEIIAHKNARANMVALKMPGPARVTFTEETEVHLGGKEVVARYFGRGHTDGDAGIYFPALKVLHTGDLCVIGGTPVNDYASGASIVQWTHTLDGMLQQWDFDVVIPGHGPVSKREDLQKYRDRLAEMRERVRGAVRDGKSPDDVKTMLASDFKWNLNSTTVAGLINELRQ